MFIAHLPAGYISATMLLRRFRFDAVNSRIFVACGAFGAIAPDLDMFYFHFVDHGKQHHHNYFTHFPLLWATLLLGSLIWFYYGRSRSLAALAAIFSLNGLIHIVLDTVVGAIKWFAPFSGHYFSLFSVPALYKPWWLNFILHWSFALEIAILTLAIFLWNQQRKTRVASLRAGSCSGL